MQMRCKAVHTLQISATFLIISKVKIHQHLQIYIRVCKHLQDNMFLLFYFILFYFFWVSGMSTGNKFMFKHTQSVNDETLC